MLATTLCYIEKDGQYLMLHRTKKEHDLNEGKWIGIGGKFEEKESPEECLLREVWEETGLTLTDYTFRGVVTFVSDQWETEQMFLYTASAFTGEMIECNEGDLKWVSKAQVMELNLWEGDKLFLPLLMESEEFFTMKLSYEGDLLVEAVKDGKENLL
ncbi:MAG: 8-oxo-dGTP diphosphatase [Lachnospira sp.]|nr:8-oxo-dGTP diphosphatase [Lachnospira sp.]